MKKYKIGYTQGTYDMFHIGHLNLLRQAKEQCERLIVGINSDRLVQEYKNKTPVVNEHDRMEIVKELRCVDDVLLCETLKKTTMWSCIIMLFLSVTTGKEMLVGSRRNEICNLLVQRWSTLNIPTVSALPY